ncbi:hypothetical protein SCHPADRAFT_942423 [Schizopora paradoxa]|uniref:DUF6533 domain-containing protein n=1 Tax=Schizopora paradoxa TaxID=27342 RepID=A0A0H2RNJ7_9AGAM|nr:hypothetical protein SCHPADRAFT_942423 [Schizopora paradoxa]
MTFMIVAAIAIQSYEYLIKFDDEVRYLWSRRLSLGGILLFLCRYLPFSSTFLLYVYLITKNFDPSHCRTIAIASMSIVYVQFLLATSTNPRYAIPPILSRLMTNNLVVLLARSYAVWGGSKKVNVIMIIWVICVTIGSCYPLALYDRHLLPVGTHTAHGCLVKPGSSNVVLVEIDFIFLFASETCKFRQRDV